MAHTIVQSGFTENQPQVTTITRVMSSVKAGNLIVAILLVEKDTGVINTPTTSGAGAFTVIQSAHLTSVSGGIAYKVADGGETNIVWTWTTPQSCQIWCAEIAGLNANPYDVSAMTATGDTAVTSRSTGTTGTTGQADELAIAGCVADSFNNVDAGRAWSNGFTEIAFIDSALAGMPGISVATKTLSAVGTVESTYSCSDTGDQMMAFVGTFRIDARPKKNTIIKSQAVNRASTF